MSTLNWEFDIEFAFKKQERKILSGAGNLQKKVRSLLFQEYEIKTPIGNEKNDEIPILVE